MFPSDKLASYCSHCLNEKSKEKRKNPATRYSILKTGWRRDGMITVPTKEQYVKMLQEANGICPACGREPQNKEIGLILHHNHITGEWIGLLCSHCNAALGYMDDSAQLLKHLHEYAIRVGYVKQAK
jgi:DNA-directed RNA polymerase subunit M/transcription elongation factor TFIIS